MLQEVVDEGLKYHKAGKYEKAIQLYNRVLNIEPVNDGLRFLMADAYMRIEHNGLAVNLLHNMLASNPKNSEAWCNLGVAYRKENHYDLAKKCWEKAIEIAGDSVEVCSNMAGLYADSGRPEEALKVLERALKIAPDNPEANWQKGLALLTMGDFAEGWRCYENRQKLPGWHSREKVNVPRWDFGRTRHLYIHGEQGVGDEVMALSVLDEAMRDAKNEITVEVNRKVAPLVRRNWPGVTVVEDETEGDYSAKIPIMSLMTQYRPNRESFPGKPYLEANPDRVDFYRAELEKMGKGPYVGLAWIGGTKQTRVIDRSVSPQFLKPIMERFTCVSVQYEDTNPMIKPEREALGLKIVPGVHMWSDLSEQAALCKALDLVITVQQTTVHVCGALGVKCYAMIPHNPQWRYGMSGDKMPWYDSVRLFRKKENEDWSRVVSEVLEAA